MFTSASKYAIRAVLFLASNGDGDKKWSADEIAVRLDVKKPFLSKILQVLVKDGLISSLKGPYGGFYLDEENRKRKLMDVLQCFDDEGVFSNCLLGLPECSDEKPCPLHIQAYAYRDGLRYQFVHQSIEDLADKIETLNLNV